HLVLNNDNENPAMPTIIEGLDFLNKNDYMDVRLPSDEEINNQKDYIILDESTSINQMVRKYCEDKKSTPRLIAKVTHTVETIIAGLDDDDVDDDYINRLIEIEYIRNKKL
ncbi:TPA: hypothetical protein ACHJXI_004574, partial [Escherichia coli]